jgi:Leucine-rich repeat (LRR) protein
LDGTLVDRGGCLACVSNTFTSCTFLDLGKTLINDWTRIVDIVCALPKLDSLNCSYVYSYDIHLYYFRHTTFDASSLLTSSQQCHRLHTLILNNCTLKWTQVEHMLTSFPSIRKLYLCENDISSITIRDTPAEKLLNELETLDVENNPIADWASISDLAFLPKYLLLNNAVYVVKYEFQTRQFKCITNTNLHNNN